MGEDSCKSSYSGHPISTKGAFINSHAPGTACQAQIAACRHTSEHGNQYERHSHEQKANQHELHHRISRLHVQTKSGSGNTSRWMSMAKKSFARTGSSNLETLDRWSKDRRHHMPEPKHFHMASFKLFPPYVFMVRRRMGKSPHQRGHHRGRRVQRNGQNGWGIVWQPEQHHARGRQPLSDTLDGTVPIQNQAGSTHRGMASIHDARGDDNHQIEGSPSETLKRKPKIDFWKK